MPRNLGGRHSEKAISTTPRLVLVERIQCSFVKLDGTPALVASPFTESAVLDGELLSRRAVHPALLTEDVRLGRQLVRGNLHEVMVVPLRLAPDSSTIGEARARSKLDELHPFILPDLGDDRWMEPGVSGDVPTDGSWREVGFVRHSNYPTNLTFKHWWWRALLDPPRALPGLAGGNCGGGLRRRGAGGWWGCVGSR